MSVGLGIDGGGSATRWAMCGPGGPIASGELGPVSGHLFNAPERDRLAAMCAALRSALAEMPPPDAVLAGITGLSATAPQAGIAAAAIAAAAGVPPARVHVEDDIWIAYHAAFAPGAGHVVYAGTGSVGVHVRADGDVVRVGGRGMLIDDAGSAFWMGRTALDTVLRSADADPAGRSVLGDAIFERIGGSHWDDVRAYVYAGGRDAVAQLARAVARAGEHGDAAALALLDRAGSELARLASALASREGAKPVALLGRAAGLHPAILEAMRREAGPLVVTRHVLDAAGTAARLARDRADANG